MVLTWGGKANRGFNRRENILSISNHGDNPFREKLYVPKTTKSVVTRNYAMPYPKGQQTIRTREIPGGVIAFGSLV